MRKIFFVILAGTALFTSCTKPDNTTVAHPEANNSTVLTDFTNTIGLAEYRALQQKSAELKDAVNALGSSGSTDADLALAQNKWKELRTIWEQCEGFLFGPVEDDEYDPKMDTWPTSITEIDSLLASSEPLDLAGVEVLPYSLRGFHPLEYVLFGADGHQTAAALSSRQKTYMLSLSVDIQNICTSLNNSWEPSAGNFAAQVMTSGAGSTHFITRRDAYLALVDGMVGICEEVGGGKMQEPLGASAATADSSLVESPYSGNSTVDFQNNIKGVQFVYLCDYNGIDGAGITDLVARTNTNLDNTLKSQITTAVNSFDNITLPYEKAIFDQRTQIAQAQAALAALKTTLDVNLRAWVIANLND